MHINLLTRLEMNTVIHRAFDSLLTETIVYIITLL